MGQRLLTALCGLLFAAAAQAAPEFSVEFEPLDDGRTRLWLSYLADGNVTALDFTVNLDVPEATFADAGRCLSSLPKTHVGLCRYQAGAVRGVIYSPTNTPLRDTNIGTVILDPGSMLKSAGASPVGIESVQVTTVTPQGITVNADVRISGLTAGK